MNKYMIYLGLIASAHSHACEDALTTNQQEILIYMMRVDSEYSETLREEFWSPWETCTLDEQNSMSKELFEIFRKGMEGQRAKYQSALLSISAGELTYDKSYIEYIESKEQFNQAKGFSSEKIKKERQQTDEFLNAALTGMPIERNGKMFSISKEIIYEVPAGIDGSEKRLKLLISPPLRK